MSDLELATFLLLDWNPSVTDIREQFPLPLQATIQIAEQAQITHPSVRNVLQIMSSDFYVDRKDSTQPNFVLQTKYVTDLEDIRTIENLSWNEDIGKVQRHLGTFLQKKIFLRLYFTISNGSILL